VIGRHRNCDDATAKQLGIVFMLFGCIVTALLTHWVIDVVGDVVLAYDPYDDVAHSSRPIGAVALGVCLLATLGFALRGAFLEARGSERALLKLLRRAQPRSAWQHFAAIAVASLVLVAAMEACDSFAAGHPCDDVVELFGGSLLLAATVAVSVAAVVTIAIRAALRHVTKFHGVLVAFVVAFIRIALDRRAPSAFEWRNSRGAFRNTAIRDYSIGDRAPPYFSSLVIS